MDDFELYNDEYNTGENEYVAERGAYERTNYSTPLDNCIGQAPEDERERKQWIKHLPDRARLCYKLKVDVLPVIKDVYNTYVDEEVLVNNLENLGNVKYLNAWGIVLGMLATNGGKNMNENNVLKIINNLPEKVAEENGIAPPDIIRYARIWHLKHI